MEYTFVLPTTWRTRAPRAEVEAEAVVDLEAAAVAADESAIRAELEMQVHVQHAAEVLHVAPPPSKLVAAAVEVLFVPNLQVQPVATVAGVQAHAKPAEAEAEAPAVIKVFSG
jgi:hypothetical protein